MNNLRTRITLFGGGLAAGGVCAFFGGDISFRDQWPLYESLRSTSSIIFAVIGAWLTILYPDAIRKVFSRNSSFDESGVNDIELMVSSIRYSTGILALIVVVGIVAQILKTFPWAVSNAYFFRVFSFGLLGFLTYLQFCTLLMTLAQAELAREKVSIEASRKKLVSKFNSQVQFKKEKEKKGNDLVHDEDSQS